MMKLLFLLPLFALTGCTMTGTARLVRALSKDPATVSIVIPSPYGTVRFTRAMPLTNQVVIVSPDGTFTIKGTP